MTTTSVEYRISLHPSKFAAYQSKKGSTGVITNFISQYHHKNFDWFVGELIAYQLVERVCLERAFNKIRLKNRCKRQPICAPNYIARAMFDAMILNNQE